MTRYAAFLRGINLGKRRVKMATLRDHVRELGLDDVATILASGNVMFDAEDPDPAALEARIEAHLEQALGFEVPTFLRTLDHLAGLPQLDPVAAAEADNLTVYVTFLRTEPGSDVAEALRALETPDDRFHVAGREVFWFRRGRLSDSTIKTRHLERAFGSENTRRRLDTVRRIVEKFGPE